MNFLTKEPINKGWSNDKKYCITDKNGTQYLLRVSDLAEHDKKQSEFNMIKQVSALGVPMCQPIEFGVCDEGVYSIQSWIDGADAEEIIPTLSDTEQYVYGLEAGRILRKIHSIPAPAKSLPAWQVFKHKELAAKIAALTEDLEELRSEKALLLQQFDYAEDAGAETFRKDIAVLESNLEKLDEQEQKYSVELETALHEYAEAKSKTAGLDPVELYEARQSIRPGQEAAANEKLEQVFGEKYSPLRWMDAKRAQMRLTNDSVEEYAARQLAKQKCKSMLQPARRREQEHAL